MWPSSDGLAMACKKNRVDDIKNCLQYGIPVNDRFEFGHTPLHIAVINGNLEAAEFLTSNGADITLADEFSLTPLHRAINEWQEHAIIDLLLSSHIFNARNPVSPQGLSHFHISCMRNKSNIVEVFIQNGEDVNMQTSENSCDGDPCNWLGYTPLHFAIEYGCKNVVELLLAYDADINIVNQNGMNPLQYAIEMKNPDIINSIRSKREMKISDWIYRTTLSDLHIECVCFSNIESVAAVIKEIKQRGQSIDKCVDSDSPCWPGCTALHLAVEYQNTEIVKLLLVHGADITIRDARGITPLHLAFRIMTQHQTFAGGFRQDIVDSLLLEHCCFKENPIDNAGLSHLHILCTRSNGTHSTSLFKKGLRNGIRDTIFSNVLSSLLQSVPLNINGYVDFNSTFWPGYTPLHFAIQFRAVDIVKILLRPIYNTDITAKNGLGLTPLHFAIECMKSSRISINQNDHLIGIIKLIFLASTEKNIKVSTYRGFSDLHLACMTNSKIEIVERILDFKIDINKPIDSDVEEIGGCAALHFAVESLQKGITKLLLYHGADVTLKNAEGNTPLHLLFQRMQTELGEVSNA